MQIEEKIPFIRIIITSDYDGEETWAIAGIIRMLNVIRVWVHEVELRLFEIDQKKELSEENLAMFIDSARLLNKLLKQAYVVLQNHGRKQDLAFLEEELFRFETMYLTSDLRLAINEKRIEFEHDRYEFLRHNLHATLHDLAQPLSILTALVSMAREGQQAEIQVFFKDAMEVMVQCKAQIERGFELVEGSFEMEQIPVSELESLSKETLDLLLRPESISYHISNRVHEGSVMYSRVWFRGLIANIVENAKKSFWIKGEQMGHGDFERIINLSFVRAENSQGIPILQLGVSDSGIGFSHDVLLEGFEEGKSEWDNADMGNQGVGMVTHVGFIKKLGGEVVLRNINEDGHVVGAELVIKLPLV